MCKSGIGNYLKRIEATIELDSSNTRTQSVTRVTYVSSEYSSEVNESHNPTFFTSDPSLISLALYDSFLARRGRFRAASSLEGVTGSADGRDRFRVRVAFRVVSVSDWAALLKVLRHGDGVF